MMAYFLTIKSTEALRLRLVMSCHLALAARRTAYKSVSLLLSMSALLPLLLILTLRFDTKSIYKHIATSTKPLRTLQTSNTITSNIFLKTIYFKSTTMKNVQAICTSILAMAALAFAAPLDPAIKAQVEVTPSAPAISDMANVASGMESPGLVARGVKDDSSATATHGNERRGEIDRLQPDRNQPIDFSLISQCYIDCFGKFNLKGSGTYNVFEVSVKNFCDYPHGALWNDWFMHGPNHCIANQCSESDWDAGADWYEKNCGR